LLNGCEKDSSALKLKNIIWIHMISLYRIWNNAR
jgi:hypothetical protein